MLESFLEYRRGRYLWVAIALCCISIVWFWLDAPEGQPRNGGTWVGYTLGTIGALLIVWLAAFGVRKRAYLSTMGTVQGWLSAHVYLGLALAVVASLHSSLQFGWNIHSLTYVLMMMVIISGAVGAVFYRRYPRLLSANRQQLTQTQLLQRLRTLDAELVDLSKSGDPEIQAVVSSALNGTQLGGSFMQQLRGHDTSQVQLPSKEGAAQVSNTDQTAVLDWLAARLSKSTHGASIEHIREIKNNLSERRALLQTIRRDIQIRALLDVWLYFHVPLSVGLLVALSIHIVSVFLYW